MSWRLLTLGLTGVTVDELASYVDAHDAVIVDIRLVPKGPTPEWTMERLQARFHERYRWVREWALSPGGRGILDISKGAARVSDIWLRGRAPLLLCGCRTLTECHRLRLAEQCAEELGVVVRHLGQVAPDPEQGGLWT